MSAKFSRTSLSFLVCSILLCIVSAGKHSNFARSRGFNPNLRKRGHADYGGHDNEYGKDYRFLNDATKPFQVDHLPDVPFDVGEMYAGLMPIDMRNESRALYFVFQPTIGEPVDELTIWLNGGPGCSSLIGFFQENGRFIWNWGMYTPQINPYSWVNLTNMLWVEQPVGTGFSTGEVTATSEEEIAEDFVGFLLNFEKLFGIKNFKIYVTGESYAGRYVPYISAAILDKNDTEYFNLSGAIAYDPVIGNYDWANEVAAFPYVQQYNNIMGLNSTFMSQLESLDQSCGYASYRDQYLTFPPTGIQPPKYPDSINDTCDIWDLAYYTAYGPNPCFNVYEITGTCPLLSDPLVYPTDLQYGYPGLTNPYFNRTDVKQAMHAPIDFSWLECASTPVFISNSTGPESEGDISADPIQSILPRIIEATSRVLMSNGAYDMEIITNGTLLSIQNMTWGGQLGFQNQPNESIIITLPDLMYQDVFEDSGSGGLDAVQGVMGVQHEERGLMWAETWGSGHMQPQFQPRSSYRHLQWVLGRIDVF